LGESDTLNFRHNSTLYSSTYALHPNLNICYFVITLASLSWCFFVWLFWLLVDWYA